jgi:hypothetical protein
MRGSYSKFLCRNFLSCNDEFVFNFNRLAMLFFKL